MNSLASYDVVANRFTEEGAMRSKPPISNLLPRDARDALAAAVAAHPQVPAGSSPTRTRELEAAIERVKHQYPTYFQQEKDS